VAVKFTGNALIVILVKALYTVNTQYGLHSQYGVKQQQTAAYVQH